MDTYSKKRLALFVTLAATLISGCTSFRADTHDEIQYNSDLANKMLYKNSKAEGYSQVHISDDLWLGPFSWGDSTSLRPDELLSTLTYNYTEKMLIEDALSVLARDSGAQISLDDSAKIFLGIEEDDDDSSSNSNAGNMVPVQRTNPDGELITYAQPVAGSNVSSNNEIEEIFYLLNGKRSFEGWLNKIALELGLFWSYSYIGDKPFITISGAIEDDIQFEGLLTNQGTQSNTNVESAWEELKTFAKESLTEVGQVNFSESTGRIYVSDRPDVINKIKRRVSYENSIFSSQIHYRVQVMTVDLDENEVYEGGFNTIYQNLSESFALNNGVALGSGVQMSVSKTDDNSNFNGSNAEFTLSNILNKRSNIQEYSFVARNRAPVNQSFKDVENYVRSISTSTTDNGTVVSPEVDELEEGIEISFLGSIISGNRIALDLSFTQEYVSGRTQESYSDNMITLPRENNAVVLNQFFVNSGQSFILSDANTNRATANSGPGRKLGILEWFFGASTSTTKNNSVRFLIITPTIVNSRKG